tara:strand:+ start:17796 stop:18041 length:246 start_codon:yes stop_codon:yes gene_type:complete
MTANTILRNKREYYKVKRIKLLERKEELINEGKPLLATALEFAIDSVQEFISDLTEMIEQIDNTNEYKKICEQLINNQINK